MCFVPFSLYNGIVKIKLPSGMLEGMSLHFPKTIVVSLSGPGAVAKASPAWLKTVLCGAGGVPVEAVEEFYRFQNPTRWFLLPNSKMSQTVYDNLHGRSIKVPGTEIQLELEHVDREIQNNIHWLPITYPVEAVKRIVTALTGDNYPEVFRLKRQEGRWGARCRPTRTIPQYVSEVAGRRDQWDSIMITRLTECQHCSATMRQRSAGPIGAPLEGRELVHNSHCLWPTFLPWREEQQEKRCQSKKVPKGSQAEVVEVVLERREVDEEVVESRQPVETTVWSN